MGGFVSVPRAKIAIDAIPLLSPLTGVGNYIHHLVSQFGALAPQYEYVYYYGYFTKKVLRANKSIYAIKDFLWRLPLLKTGLRGIRGTGARFHPGEFDLYFEPNFIPLKIRAKKIVTTVHDFSFRLFPDAHPKDRIRYFEKHFGENIRRSDRVITVSSYVKDEAAELLGIQDEMITPIHLGVNHEMFKSYPLRALESCRRELALPDNFVLFVGTREPRKNLNRLVQAYAELPECIRKEFGLVIVGPRGWGESNGLARAKTAKRITVIDYVETAMLARIYNLASAFVYPSLYEGFGLPPLEAMACGCPVIASRAASLPEVCSDAAYYVNPNDVQSIAEGLNNVLTDSELKQALIEKGRKRAEIFTWDRTARQTLQVFADVLNGSN